MKKQIVEELNGIKYLFNYNRGKIISEQEKFEAEDIDIEDIDIDDYDEDEEEDINYLKGEFDEEIIEKREVEVPVRPGTKEREKTKTPSTPYKPKPGPKPDPKARKRKGDMPDWLTFDELGIDFE